MPRPLSARLGLEAFDLLSFFHRQPNVVETIEQAMFPVSINVEAHDTAIRSANLLRFEINGQSRIGAAFRVVHQLFQILGRDFDRQNAVFKAVIVKNIRETRRDYAADSIIEEGPGRMFAR